MNIIRYANRKYYVKGPQGRYINLKDIRLLIDNHVKFKVIDNVTKNDVTNKVIAQVIANCVDASQDDMLDLIRRSKRTYESQQPLHENGVT